MTRTYRTWFVLLSVGVLTFMRYPGLGGPPGEMWSERSPVVVNAEIARKRMERIFWAISAYMNVHLEPPPTLSTLYPEIIDDPLVFWHPGDSDPPPTTIDNDVPNAPNSSQISFEVDLELYDPWCPGESPFIRDNSPDNNAGLFVNEFFGGPWYGTKLWYTTPAGMIPWPNSTAVARENLRALARAVHIYSVDNEDWWPQTAMQLVPLVGPPCGPARAFWHPGDDQPMPTEITTDELNAPNSAQISFEYLVGGLNEGDYDPDLVFWQDNTSANNGGFGTLVAYADERVEYLPVCPGDATGNQLIDFEDATFVFYRLGTFRSAAPWGGDLNGDSNCDLLDAALLQQRYGAACPY